jgi:hypothetical protein
MITTLVTFSGQDHQVQRNASGSIWHFWRETGTVQWYSEGLPLTGGFVGNPILYVDTDGALTVECEQGASNESLMVNSQLPKAAWSGWNAKA